MQKAKHILEVTCLESGKIRLSLANSLQSSPIAHYQEAEVAIEKIDGLAREITHLLNRVNNLKNPGRHFFSSLQRSCQLLYDELLSQEIKVSLQSTPVKNLEFILDEQLVHIPWELLFDGQRFFCEQFNIGRQIRTRENRVIQNPSVPQSISHLRILIITDPNGDLEVASQEGVRIYEGFQIKQESIKAELQSFEQVNVDFVRKSLRDYDLIHYAGHVDYDAVQPRKSGWILSDGKFYASDILKMAGGKSAMPRLVFCNACQSGITDKWAREKGHTGFLPLGQGLVHAFLMAGVQHYIGTFCDVSDEYGAFMGVEFYHYLLQGNMIGESLRKARESFQKKFGRECLTWINYVLYGDPAQYLIKPEGETTIEQKSGSGPYQKDSLPIILSQESEHAPEHIPVSEPSPLRRRRFYFSTQCKWMKAVIIALLSISLIALLIFVMSRTWNPPPHLSQIPDKQERIKELKKIIYEKLKEQGAKTGALPAGGDSNESTSMPVTIAIFAYIDSEPLPDWTARIIKDLNRKLTQRFVDDTRIRVAERKELDKLLEEKDLILSDLPLNNQKDRNLFGRFLYANTMIFLEGYQSLEGVFLCYKVVDVDTGEIIKINSGIKLSKKGYSVDLARQIYEQTANIIPAKYPPRGKKL